MDYPKCPNPKCSSTVKGRIVFMCPACSKYCCNRCGKRDQCPHCKQKQRLMEVGKIVPRS